MNVAATILIESCPQGPAACLCYPSGVLIEAVPCADLIDQLRAAGRIPEGERHCWVINDRPQQLSWDGDMTLIGSPTRLTFYLPASIKHD